jgi:hypothetical protein
MKIIIKFLSLFFIRKINLIRPLTGTYYSKINNFLKIEKYEKIFFILTFNLLYLREYFIFIIQ